MSSPPDLSHVRRIYVRAPNWVGDFVMATATFARLRAAFPDAHLTLGLRPFLLPLLDGKPVEGPQMVVDIYDLVRHEPRPAYRDLYLKVKEQFARAGLNFG